jgi:DNA-binding transcriptional LysR family regulator
LSAPVAYGQHVLAPLIFDYLQRNPAVRIDLRLSDDRVNLVSEGYDLAVRIGRLDDSELVSRRIDWCEMVLAASPAYLERSGMPETVQDLTQAQAILTRPDLDHWTVAGETVRVIWCISTGNMLVTCQAACAGLGIAMLPCFIADRALAAGELVQILPDQPIAALEVTALYAVTPSVALNALVDFVARGSPKSGPCENLRP